MSAKSEKFMIVSTDGHSLLNFRGPLIGRIANAGYETVCVSIEDACQMQKPIEELGARYVQVAGDRTGISIGAGLKMIRAYEELLKREKPDHLFLFMSKPTAFGGAAAINAKVPHYSILVNGLENAFYRTTAKDALVRQVMHILYKHACSKADNVFFQNHDDRNHFLKHKLARKNQTHIIGGSGVDMKYFKRQPLPEAPVFLMTARLLWSKGIREFLAATKILKQYCQQAKILLVGGLDDNDEAITKSELDAAIAQSDIEYCGYTDDVRDYLKRCSVFVLPSYHEGMPRSVLEAMACGRAIITTDVPGCREAVIDAYNGLIVPSHNVEQLAAAMVMLAQDSHLRDNFAQASYERAAKLFDVEKVNDDICAAMGLHMACRNKQQVDAQHNVSGASKSKHKHKVSIIMATYNCEDTLDASMQSIFNQTFNDWQLVICDDASTDNTWQRLQSYQKQYKDKIVLVRNKTNSRLAASLNNCLQHATGEYIARMDADDISLPQRLEKQVAFLDAHKEYAVVGTSMIRWDGAKDFDIYKAPNNPNINTLLHEAPFCHATIMMRKSVYDALGGYVVKKRTRRGQDRDLWFRFFAAGFNGANIAEPLYKVREDETFTKRSPLKYDIDGVKTRLIGFKSLHVPPYKYYLAFQPIVSHFVPRKLKLARQRKRSKV